MKTLIAVSALINRGDDYLFIKQNKVGGAYPDTLHLPGGRIEPEKPRAGLFVDASEASSSVTYTGFGFNFAENPQEAVAREIEEEVGLTNLDFKVADFDWDTIDYKGEPTRFIFLRFTATLTDDQQPTPGDDAEEVIWVNKADLPTANLNAPTQHLLNRLSLL